MTEDTRQDRRVRRTRTQLNAALIELIVEKGYDKITVQDLIDRADIGRSTFYAHYETKDDLLVAGLDHLTNDIEMYLLEDPSATAILPSLGVFRHLGEHHELFKALLGSKGIDLVNRATRDLLTERAAIVIEARAASGETSALPNDARAAFLAGSLLSLATWWLDNDMPHSPEDMAEMYQTFTSAV